MATKNFAVLGIDTSCDDTCISLVAVKSPGPRGDSPEGCKSKVKSFDVLSSVVSSQVKLHAKYGGVYPSLAKREHQRNLPIVFKKVLRQAQNKPFDLVGVTIGPGLEPCLWQGINFAKELAKKFQKPLIPVNHIEAHILANFIDGYPKSIKFPAVCLVVSGGHTRLILMRDMGKYQLIGETRDDAAGECFDKAARILGLEYPGGPAIAKLARGQSSGNCRGLSSVTLPRPMIYQKNYDFSFSGLKTAVLYKCKSQKSWTPGGLPGGLQVKSQKFIRAMCAEVQQAIIDVLMHKTLKAAKDYRIKSIILGGGVVANEELRKQFRDKFNNVIMPPKALCTDNAAMVAVTAFFHRKNIKKDIGAEANLRM